MHRRRQCTKRLGAQNIVDANILQDCCEAVQMKWRHGQKLLSILFLFCFDEIPHCTLMVQKCEIAGKMVKIYTRNLKRTFHYISESNECAFNRQLKRIYLNTMLRNIWYDISTFHRTVYYITCFILL